MICEFNLTAPSKLGMKCVENPFNMAMCYKIKVSFNMGTYSHS